MRLVYWMDQFHPYIGGLEVLAANVLPRLEALGFSCHVITSKGPMELADEDHFGSIPVYRFPFRSTLESRDPVAFHRLVRRIGELEARMAPALVHIFVSDPSFAFHLAARRFHPSCLIVSLHNWGPLAPEAGQSLLGRLLTEADWALGNSSFTLDRLREVAPECGARSSVLYSGVAEPLAAASPLSLEPLRLLCVGRLVEAKGFDLALHALARLHSQHPGVSLQLVGDGPARPALEALAQNLGLGAAVEFAGWVEPERIYDWIDRASVVLIPSRWAETLCQVAIQAAMMERPVVAARIGGVPEVVVDGQTGVLFEPENAAALADGVERLMQSPQRTAAMAATARTRALSTFSLSSYVDGVAALYRRVGAV